MLGALSRTITKLRATVNKITRFKRLEEGIKEAQMDKLEED